MLVITMESILFEFGVILILAAVLGLIAQAFKQPTIFGYIVAGMIVNIVLVDHFTGELLELFAKLGIAFLLFMLGVELNIKEVKEVGPAALATGVGQVLITFSLGFSIAKFLFGMVTVEAVYVAIALTFSSTIVIVKLLGEKGDLNALYGRISVGLLIVQDIIAVLAIIILNSLVGTGGQQNIIVEIGTTIMIGALLIGLALIIGRGLELMLEHVGKSTEILLLAVLSWSLIFAFLAQSVGFSLEAGAFLAGLVLSSSPLSAEIAAKVKPLRDFFIIIFFIVLGVGLSPSGITNNILIILMLSAFVLIGNPIILLSIMGRMGYHRHVSFLAGLTVSQISEFSLIIVSMGFALNQISGDILSIVTGIAIITLIISSYLITHGDRLYTKLSEPLRFFQKAELTHHHQMADTEFAQDGAVVIGAHRMGGEVIQELKRRKVNVIAIDYDPITVAELKRKRITAIYGDLGDPELLDQFNDPNIKVIVSTVPTYEDNLLMLAKISEFGHTPVVIVRGETKDQARELKKLGAAYVLIPEEIAGEKINDILIHNDILADLSKSN